MNINLIYRHPCEMEIESLLGREEPYPDTFTPADCATERLTRARTGLVHVMNEIAPSVGGEQATVINSWLQKVTSLLILVLTELGSPKCPPPAQWNANSAPTGFILFWGFALRGPPPPPGQG